MTTCLPTKRPRSCNEVEGDVGLTSGVYTVYPTRFDLDGVKVYCDFDTDRGRWTVFLNRQNGELNFYRPWASYLHGFGDPAGEHWLGLEYLRELTEDGPYQLRVVLEDFDGECVYAQYDSFYIDAECDGYKLHVSGFTDGGAGDSLSVHNGNKFSTFDNDQDNSTTNCAQRFLGAHWYNACYDSNPTGIYQWGHVIDRFSNGMIWSQWKGLEYSVKGIIMMFRSLD
ncbi:microfibril-associated glycoprotein 4-like [Salarias fasciatus]|uniref:microfibril-associated glycoprotein 4-like n=1 Tax=Salarias fasciatus TaxID=181472 RepID=UPI0011770254|nr:microfibril-associated glycoprotein 4-like [Salarias fasciatus]